MSKHGEDGWSDELGDGSDVFGGRLEVILWGFGRVQATSVLMFFVFKVLCNLSQASIFHFSGYLSVKSCMNVLSYCSVYIVVAVCALV